MIEDSKYKQILEDGLLLDHYYLLCKIANGEKLIQSKRVQGFINLLIKKDYIEDDKLTEKAKLLLEKVDIEAKVEYKESNTSVKNDLFAFATQLHGKVQTKIFELTGKKQITSSFSRGAKTYSFLPNATDLHNVLYRVVGQYKLKPEVYPKIEAVIMRYVEHCNKTKNWFPVLQYYISKDRKSPMVTDLENFDEEDQDNSTFKSNQKLL